LAYKQQQVIDSFVRIGKIEMPEVSPIIGSGETQIYRNKLEYTFSNRRWLTREEISGEVKEMNGVGFHVPGRFDKVLDVERCYLQREPSNAIRLFIREHAIKNNLEFFDLRNQTGFLRTLVIRTAETGEVMVILVFFREEEESRIKLLEEIKSKFKEVTSLYYVINSKANDTLGDQEFILYHGKDHILEKMDDLFFKVGPKSFYQTNSRQAHELYKKASEFAGIKPTHTVYDLYTGTGTIANFVAGKAKKVIGIEYVPEAIEDAKVNSALNGIKNTLFFAGDMKDILSEVFVSEHGHPSVMIIDPPRVGMHKDVVETICRILPDRIVYVSCNPATQARDIQLMDEFYILTGIQPVDMFPHTHHVENIALLERR
jgi:23S rRNA (uracil1939-C5)-methyltransferase